MAGMATGTMLKSIAKILHRVQSVDKNDKEGRGERGGERERERVREAKEREGRNNKGRRRGRGTE